MNIQLQPKLNQNKEKWLELARENNFTYEVDELAFFVDEKRKQELIDYYKNTGLVTSMHGAFIDINPVSNDPLIAKASADRCEESCQIAKKIGATNIVFHSSAFPFLRGTYLDLWVKKAADFYCNLARKYEINIYIENSMDLDPEPIYRLMRQCEVPYVRACLDFGHVNYSREPFETWVDILGEYIEYVHISDNVGLFDDHLTIGKGIVPWDIVDNILGCLKKEISLTLETGDIVATKNSIEYLKEKNLILHYNQPFRREFSTDHFKATKNAQIKEFGLSDRDKEEIEVRKFHARAEKFERRNEIMQAIFSKYLSNEIVHRALEKPESLKLGGKKKKLTLMMSDLHGFTQMSEDLEAEDLIKVLNNYFSIMMEVIHSYHGTIIDIVGDGMLVAFGLFEDTDIHADKAIAAAMEMQICMKEVNKWNKKNGYPKLYMGIGINTGNVVVGNIGSRRHIKYGVVGKNVNMCSRIESYTYNRQILISQATKDECKSELQIDSIETVYPKGAKSDVTLYHVTKIGGEFNKEYIPKKLKYKEISNPLPIEFSFIHSKHRTIESFKAEMISLSMTGAIIRTNEQLEIRDNIAIDIGEPLFGKITNKSDGDNMWELSFTAIPPIFEEFMRRALKRSSK